MGGGLSSIDLDLENELKKPMDGSDVATPRGESAKNEVIRLRKIFYEQSRTSRLESAVLGAFLADAASQALQWNYQIHPDKMEIVQQEEGQSSPILFFPPSEQSNRFFNSTKYPNYYNQGSFSPFGDYGIHFFHSVKDQNGLIDIDIETVENNYKRFTETYAGYKTFIFRANSKIYRSGKQSAGMASHPLVEQSGFYIKAIIAALVWKDAPKEIREKNLIKFIQTTHIADIVDEHALFIMRTLLYIVDGETMDIMTACEKALKDATTGVDSAILPWYVYYIYINSTKLRVIIVNKYL